MTGVTILKSTTYSYEYLYNRTLLFAIVGGILVAIAFTLLVMSMFDKLRKRVPWLLAFPWFLLFGMIGAGMLGTGLGGQMNLHNLAATRYEVHVDGSVKFGDFYDKYLIISGEYPDFTVKEKKDVKE